jgi:hypothetical protein
MHVKEEVRAYLACKQGLHVPLSSAGKVTRDPQQISAKHLCMPSEVDQPCLCKYTAAAGRPPGRTN